MVNNEKAIGFISTFGGHKPSDIRENNFVHISSMRDERGVQLRNSALANLRTRQAIPQFDIGDTDGAKPPVCAAQEME